MGLNSFLPHNWHFPSDKGEVVELLVVVSSRGDHGGAGLWLPWLAPCFRPAISLVPVTVTC